MHLSLSAREGSLGRRHLNRPPFHEGGRAAVTGKVRNPEWVPATLAEVTLPPLGDAGGSESALMDATESGGTGGGPRPER